MNANEKDAMALAVLDRIGTAPISETERGQVAEARAHLASRIAELEELLNKGIVACLNEAKRADRAEAELAAAKDQIARILQTNAARRGMGPWPDATRGGE